MHNVLNLFKDIWFSMVLVRSCHAAVKVELVATSRMRMLGLGWGESRAQFNADVKLLLLYIYIFKHMFMLWFTSSCTWC